MTFFRSLDSSLDTLPHFGILMSKTMSILSLYGEKLKEELNATRAERTPLIEGFLYERSVLMVSADPGVGKSTITAQAIAQMSCGLPVFGCLYVPKPIRCMYIPFERGREEILERLKIMQELIPMDYENIYINDSFIGYDVLTTHHADTIIDACKCVNPDVVILDPIYACVAGGLSTDEKASQFTRFSARLQAEVKCANWLNHHTTKQSYNNAGEPIEKEDPFYGSQWLKAHCTAGYYLKKNIDSGTTLLNKKDTMGNLLKKIKLDYNQEDYISFMDSKNVAISPEDRIRIFLRTKFKSINKTFTFDELLTCVQPLSSGYLRKLMIQVCFSECITKSKSTGKKTLYEVIKEV